MQSCVNNLMEHGAHVFGEILDVHRTQALYQQMIAARAFDGSLFMDQAEYLAQENHFNANPTKTFNFLNQFEEQLQFIEQDPRLTATSLTFAASTFIRTSSTGPRAGWSSIPRPS